MRGEERRHGTIIVRREGATKNSSVSADEF
jgi:hypothetical protein